MAKNVAELEALFDPDFNDEIYDAIGLAVTESSLHKDAYKKVLEVIADKFKN